jgi:hypothetical protein
MAEAERAARQYAFVGHLVEFYGFTGDAAARWNRQLNKTLAAGRTIDYDALGQEAAMEIRAEDLRALFLEAGLDPATIDAFGPPPEG